ncbi:hypothetical protein CRUP_020857 [Coryphaenoides rupestris]|nr:hypothetical protein CRUP_020857 [Coryphaenoides rupestris]
MFSRLHPVDCGGASAAAAAAVALGRFWVPRIRVLFGAEDPRAFAERVQAAQRARETAEATVLYRLSVARMPVWTGPGCVSLPDYPFQRNRAAFVSGCLLTRAEVLSALCDVRSQCCRLGTVSLFQSSSTKPQRLEDFLLGQAQTHAQVPPLQGPQRSPTRKTRIYSTCIIRRLRPMGRGWYDLSESCWDVYRMSKMCQLLAQVRYRLQDALRSLVQGSLRGLARLVLDACHGVPARDLVWGSDLITSPYGPKKNPLFLVDLVLDHTGVHYSTPLEKFESSVVTVFDQVILATHNVPQLDKFVMTQMFFSGARLLESVGLWEPAVCELREEVGGALRRACGPLRAYAAQAHKQAEQTAQEVKKEVLELLREKERLESSLPSLIVIGPIEELSDQRDWMQQIPDLLKTQEVRRRIRKTN